MGWVSLLAVFFIVWWTVLFIALPFGLRTQDEDGEVTLGTTASAPRGPHMLRALIRTTIIAIVICGVLVFITRGLGYSFDDIPRLVPTFD
ncbi:DUF1467 family protein [Nitratireductor aquimarinus]|uniref:DUF1467 family protein n=1 Tax=Alphaproteobacteria TaxID=28211 RepID=UPI0019D3E74C|nr:MULTISPECIES: DUF1467 family protein [Alphaproteobacteria]MBY6024026.1 DUF1467 family protein [Nitratireductor sp. DP7N14-4]MBN7759065.1 DUF1467 family protein [Nitratireductor aquimarinus]MBN7777060.1 DUF1467 family protein [Nitratireductor pacificus]MBN7780394.1 DUF1467 family protein [Nitratireductor pacificus]MBN7789201.1 DUF1467 family protein [Nitratireductor aquimarinus]